MKVLFFHATAGHPKVAPPLMNQAGNVLRPFNRFLGQAIHTAKQRQTRYQLPWERVRNLLSIRLDPSDSLLRVPRRLPGVVLADWPSGKAHDFTQMGFVLNRSVPVRFQAATPTAGGLRVRADVPLLPTDRVFWAGVESAVKQEAAPAPPRQVTDPQGRALKLVAPPRADADDRHWLILVEGNLDDCDLVVDGEEVEAEALPTSEGLRRVVDKNGASFDVSGGMLRAEEPPADGLLRGDNGVRYRWHEVGSAGRRGCWIQLLPPESSEADEFLDPRAAFCEGDVSEVLTDKRRRKDTTFKVKKVDQDRYQLLLDRYPPDGSTLYLPVDLRNLYLQKRALRQLSEAPLPHHQGLLRLCEDPQHARWPQVSPEPIAKGGWRALTDATRSGTDEQRSFVQKALGSPDFAFLEGPPGSGKTTAICEIVQQLVEKGQRVLLCASTHVAIDNVLERLLESTSPIDAVRIGKLDKVDEKVQATQLDERVNALIAAWRRQPAMGKYGDAELEEMAERTVIMAANLTCGTTMGIVNHPLFQGRDEDMQVWERPITTMPHWDVLMVDEASKTLIQEFMVPALMAKRWIVVGDVRQLPPFADRADIVANLRDLVDENDKPVFPADHQRACLLIFRLIKRQLRQPGMRWLIVERPGVLEWIARELEAEPAPDLSVVRVVAKGGASSGSVNVVTVAQLRAGKPEALLLAASDWVLVGDDLIGEVANLLPGNLLVAEELSGAGGPLAEGDALLTRQAWWLQRAGSLQRSYQERKFRREDVSTFADAQACEVDWLRRNDLAQEIAWRITRLHELRHSRNERERKRLRDDLGQLQPLAVSIEEPIAEIEDIGLPSILEVLQEGIGVDRAKRRSALTAGLKASRPADFAARFESLSYQHRMHAEIASFSREVIYEGQALRDANTIQIRDTKLGWDFGQFRARRVWGHVDGREQGGVNGDEIKAMAALLRDFIAWAKRKGPPARDLPRMWEVACLCFYVKQERAISDMLREVTQDDRKTRFVVRDAPVEIVCGTVDRFQGREADLVMLSMRNTRRVGFLDSPNRLNVGVTRARQQLVVFGKADYFTGCRISELEELARRTPLIEEQEIRRWRRGNR
ncbi:MAG: DEAD/DEAH box helicase family protein [Phycisphaerales bacterium]|nr:DEAD/DEAH box helicase family protein [Phycisphaerales bacterium]